MTPVAETEFSITHRDMGWGELYELRIKGWSNVVATLRIEHPMAWRSSSTPPDPAINWSAVGEQSLETTRAFARGLLALAEKIPKEPA